MRMILVATLALAPLMAKDSEPAKRLDAAAGVFSEVMAAPDKGIPEDLLAKSRCIVIVPSLKTAAFVVGAKFGKGFLSCRNEGGGGVHAEAPEVELDLSKQVLELRGGVRLTRGQGWLQAEKAS